MRMTMKEKKEEGPPSAPMAAMLFLATLVGEFIRWWREDFYIYVAGAYEKVDVGYIAWLVREFIVDEWGVAEAEHEYVKAVVETIKQARYVDSRFELPFRLDGSEMGNCLVLNNGTLHLGKMLDGGQPELRPHDPNCFSLGKANYNYDPAARAPLYERFLNWMTRGCERTRELLLEMMFYCLMLTLQYQVFFWQLGVGSNGKSVYLHVLRHLIGINSVSAVPLERLGARFQTAALLGRRANLAVDVHELTKMHEGALRRLSDGSPVDFERKFRDTVTTIVQARLFFASNAFPPVRDRSNGLWRRLILIPCEAQVVDEIPQFEKKLIPELPGILNLTIAAGARLIPRGHFDVPERCRLEKEKYKLELDTSRSFCRDCLIFARNGFEISGEIYSYYRAWCTAHGHSAVNAPNFWRSFHMEMQKPISDGTITQKKPTLDGRRVPGWFGLRYVSGGADLLHEPLPPTPVEPDQPAVVPTESVLPAKFTGRRTKREIAAATDGYTPADLRRHREWEKAQKKTKLQDPSSNGAGKLTEAELTELDMILDSYREQSDEAN